MCCCVLSKQHKHLAFSSNATLFFPLSVDSMLLLLLLSVFFLLLISFKSWWYGCEFVHLIRPNTNDKKKVRSDKKNTREANNINKVILKMNKIVYECVNGKNENKNKKNKNNANITTEVYKARKKRSGIWTLQHNAHK